MQANTHTQKINKPKNFFKKVKIPADRKLNTHISMNVQDNYDFICKHKWTTNIQTKQKPLGTNIKSILEF